MTRISQEPSRSARTSFRSWPRSSVVMDTRTSLSRITEGTGLGKGSLYHFFPGGKEEWRPRCWPTSTTGSSAMSAAPLRHAQSPQEGIAAMFDEVSRYFLSGRKVCLVGVFALGNEGPVRAGRSRRISAIGRAPWRPRCKAVACPPRRQRSRRGDCRGHPGRTGAGARLGRPAGLWPDHPGVARARPGRDDGQWQRAGPGDAVTP